MNLENYVCTLEQTKKLDKFLEKRESIFCFVVCENPLIDICKESDCEKEKWIIVRKCKYTSSFDWVYNAYTSQELGEIIHEFLSGEDTGYMQDVGMYGKDEFYFYCSYPMVSNENRGTPTMYSASPEAQARAEFLIHLLEMKDD